MCRTIREQDEIVCTECGRRWESNDPKPPTCNDDQSKASGVYHNAGQATKSDYYRKSRGDC